MNSSANRGSCMQSCRRAYIVTDKETGAELEIDNEYIMSPKDLKSIHFLNKLTRFWGFGFENRRKGAVS